MKNYCFQKLIFLLLFLEFSWWWQKIFRKKIPEIRSRKQTARLPCPQIALIMCFLIACPIQLLIAKLQSPV